MRKLLFLALFFTSATIFAQGTITGKVIDSEREMPLPGANVTVVGAGTGTITDFDGKFVLEVDQPSGTVEISFVGFETKTFEFNLEDGETLDLGTIPLKVDADALSEIVVIGKGVVDVAIGRETPVAVSTIRAEEIQETGGNLEFPAMLRSMPSVYANTSGGGYGDSSIRIRGFDQSNIAFLLNGQPINGMEDGNMYWSNWQGVKDIATAVQIQRGLGASKLAISSVGGTVNIVTQTYNTVEEGYVSAEIANDNYWKTGAYYTTGANELGWSSTYMLSYWEGDGNFYEATAGKGITYFFSVGYKPSDEHAFNLLLTGAPQMHGQPYQGEIAAALEYGRDYNENWGYRNGEVFNERTNFYHKPVLNFNWDWNIQNDMQLSTVAYASFGRGGGTGPLGRYSNKFNDQGQINFDEIIENNKNLPTVEIDGEQYRIGEHPSLSDPDSPNFIEGDRGYIIRASMNNHFWVGAVSNFNHELSENLEYNFGVDYRFYHGDHYRQVVDFLGLDGWYEGGNASIPGGQVVFSNYEVDLFSPTFETARSSQQIAYSNSEDIAYIGGFGQIEYATDAFSTFLQGALSSQSHIRYDYFVYSLPEQQESVKITNPGFNIKGGVNFNINDQHNVFANAGFYSRQPYHDNIFLNFTNNINPLTENEEITGLELGYGFSNDVIRINLNAYYTKWGNRTDTDTDFLDLEGDGTEEEYFTNFSQLEQTHMGVELDFLYEPTSALTVNGFISLGNWEYSDNPIQSVYDAEDLTVVPELSNTTSFIDGQKVGNAPQTSMTLGAEYEILENFSVDADWFYYADLYASIDPLSFTERGGEVIKLPSYDLVRMGASYELELEGNTSLDFRANVSNVFNEIYIASL
ncbi:MAG TPA: carboxypeptidase-like regulatory domain-containing protein, partial [Salinimicrobium sp.]|nr:carboxypeptidase-like regulatory domain-containing protein [Salinimicrobium sp.]